MAREPLDAKVLLRLLTERFPPGAGRSHALTYTDREGLCLTVWIGDQQYRWLPQIGDTAPDLYRAIEAYVKQHGL